MGDTTAHQSIPISNFYFLLFINIKINPVALVYVYRVLSITECHDKLEFHFTLLGFWKKKRHFWWSHEDGGTTQKGN